MRLKSSYLILIGLICSSLASCYSFRGISIDANIKTFSVNEFPNFADNVVAGYNRGLEEALKEKIRSESRLISTPSNGDVSFEGAIQRFTITPMAPLPGETTAFNRLDISVEVSFLNTNDETKNWKTTFSRFADFASNDNFTDVQDQLIAEINEQLLEDIFNKAFTNW